MASAPEFPSDPQVAPPLEQLTASQRALLRIACWVAWADGDLAEEERALLERLVFRLLPAEVGVMQAEDAFHALVAEPPQTADLDALVAALSSSDERQLAVKLAVQMLAVNQRPGDDAPVNPAEKQAYRRLLEALQLPDDPINRALLPWVGGFEYAAVTFPDLHEQADDNVNTLLARLYRHLPAETPEEKEVVATLNREHPLKDLDDAIEELVVTVADIADLTEAERYRVETIRRDQPKVGRNDPCPCGSGKKYKACHGSN